MTQCKDAILCKVVIKRKWMHQDVVLATGWVLSQNWYVQKDGAKYEKTMEPVIPSDGLFLIVGKFTSVGGRVHHAEIFTAFLNRDIDKKL